VGARVSYCHQYGGKHDDNKRCCFIRQRHHHFGSGPAGSRPGLPGPDGRDVPIVGNGAGALLALGIIGIAMCSLGGIGPTQSALVGPIR